MIGSRRRGSTARAQGADRRFTPWPLLALVILVLVLPTPLSAQARGAIRGTVTVESSGLPIPGAVIEFHHPERSLRVTADPDGRFSLLSLPPGRATIRVRHLGYESLDLEVIVPGGREIDLDMALAVHPVALEPVTVDGQTSVVADAADTLPASDGELALAGARAIENTPGLSELGVTDAVRGIPGDDPDPGSLLYVRGAAADLKLVYLDGAPVYAPFPLGGILEPFPPGLLDKASIYLGGAPARYDGGLSYVMDLRTRGGRGGLSTSGSVDLLSGHVMAEGALGDAASAVVSLRGMDPLGSAALFGDGMPYEYREGLARTDVRLGTTNVLSVTGFANREAVRVDEALGGDGLIEWGNNAGSARLRGVVGSTVAEATVAVGRYSARLPLTGTQPVLAVGEADRSRLSLDLSRPIEDVQLRYGASLEYQEYRAQAEPVDGGLPPSVASAEGSVAGVYAELSGQPHPRLRVRGGGRIDHFSTDGSISVAPRIAATWMVTERAAVTLAAGRYHQFLRPPDELLLRRSELTSEGMPLPASLLVGRASHFTAGLDQDLGDGLRLGLDGYYKHFDDAASGQARDANASGVDVWIRRSTDGIDGWLGYSLAWVWSSRSAVPGQVDFKGRHLLSTGFSAPLREHTWIGLRLAYGAGLPYSAIPLDVAMEQGYTPTNYAVEAEHITHADRGGTETAPLLHSPDEPFLRLDAEISQHWTTRRAGRTMEIAPYLRILNSLGRRDALFYFLDPERNDDLQPIGALPIIPVVGVEWRF